MNRERSLHAPDEDVRDGLTPRAFLIGLALCGFLGLVLPYNRMVIQGRWLNAYFIDRGALVLLFFLVLFANPLLAALRKRFALKRGELLAIYVMFLFLLPVSQMVKHLISYLTGVTYYATPERRDLEAVLPNIVPWTAPGDAEVVRGLYEGLPDGVPPPWEAWFVPLVSWGAFLLVLLGVLICLAVIVRKQWEDHERFAFPIMQVPLEMSETGNGRLGRLFRSRLMWAGFAIPFVIGSINALHHYFHTVPRIGLVHDIWIFNGTTPLRLRLHFAILGYSYFVNTDVSLSIWVFNVISKIVRGILAVLGAERYNVSGVVGRFSSQGHASLALMGMGYMVILAAYSLWVGREHLRHVAAKVLGRPSGADDSNEVMPYRTAVIGIGGGTLYLGCWLYQAGMSPPVILVLFASCFVVFLVMARIVSETGFVTAYSPINPAEFAVCMVGSSAFSPAGLVTLGFGYAWTMTRTSTLMPRAVGALWLARRIPRKRGLVWAMGLALAVGLITASTMTLKLGYAHGGLNLDRHFLDYARLPFDAFVGRRMLEPSPIFTRGFLYLGMGGAIAALLAAMRARFVWWPLHPVALPVSTIAYTDYFFINVLLAWGVKSLVLRFGGARLYRSTRPFFMGIILGEAVCTGLWIAVDYFTGTVSNMFFPYA